MNRSPFMTPDMSRQRRARAARQKRIRRLTVAGVLALVLIISAVATLLLHKGASAHDTHVSASTTAGGAAGAHASHATTPAVSPTGMALGKPALPLSGLATPLRDPVHIVFHQPPRAGMLFNLDTGQVLWEHNPLLRVPMASLTKMMTALLTVRAAPPDAPVLVTREAIATNGSKVGELPLGRHVRAQSMLYGLMLPSGNDAAVALAQHVAGTVPRFMALMNAEAARLGMGCTRYSSPSGYYDQDNFTCAADLAMLAHVDLQQPRIASVVRTYHAVLPFPIKGGKLYLNNNNPLLIYGYPGLTGMKTGYTEAAGRCLVATAERHGVRLGVVVLNSDAPGTQASQLLDRAFHDVYHLPNVPWPPLPAGA
jgi:D-alanyl-D-alanine carboxypeptidase (penicillin-binding protein 5/6)